MAINERIEEAMNYRKELRDLEVKEGIRVEKLRNENAENQRKALLSNQKKEMVQLEAKIETGRHNLKIKMLTWGPVQHLLLQVITYKTTSGSQI